MEQKRPLTNPVDKDEKKFNLPMNFQMTNPFRIPRTSECGKLKKQVSCIDLAGHRCRRDLQTKNGAVLCSRNHVAKNILESTSREPCLILTDVLKSEEGRPYLEKIKQHLSSQKQKEHVPCKGVSFICKDRSASQRMANNDNSRNIKPRSNQITTSFPSSRSRLQRRSQNVDDAGDEQGNDLKDPEFRGNYRFAEVVDCGLSVSWEPAMDKADSRGFSPAGIKDKDVLHSWQKRKKQDSESECNETSKAKRHRLSVLRLKTGKEALSSPAYVYLQAGTQGRRVGRSAPAHICLGESVEVDPRLPSILLDDGGEDVREEEQEISQDEYLHNVDHNIVQFTVGANDPIDVLLPVISSHSEPVDMLGNPAKTSPSEPIVLSSDDEEEGQKKCDVRQRCSQVVQPMVEDAAIMAKSPLQAKQQVKVPDCEDAQLVRVVVDDSSVAVPLHGEDVCMVLAFSSLYYGLHHGKSNGDIMLTNQHFIIPLKDEQSERVLSLERKELRRYSVWEQQEMQAQDIYFKDDEDPSPPTVLVLCVSQMAAAAVQRELLNLCLKQDGITDIEKMSPFILLTLDDPLEGMQGALFRSLLDIDCLKIQTESIVPSSADKMDVLGDFKEPSLSMNDSIELIRRTGRDSHLLRLLGQEMINEDLDGQIDNRDQAPNSSPLLQLEGDSQEKTDQDLEEEEEIETEPQPEEEQREQEVKSPAAKTREESTSVYTLCHHRNKGSYSMSLCKPDSRWIKYGHRGLAQRLIQFPPPPLKGGITVTMEDLQCLDSGQFLNDVIIDFYLKYLLHKATAAVAERSHIFSSFFFKQLTRRDNASEGSAKESCQRQKRHQRVKTWTRHVDIFKKDFLFVPVNQEAHWYLVVICFPGMMESKVEAWNCQESDFQTGKSQTCDLPDQEALNAESEGAPTSNCSETMDTDTENTKGTIPGPVSCTEGTCQRKTVCKRPCILIMDSLKRSLHERIFKLLRDYLESEWEVRCGSSRDFGANQMQSSHCKVPLQDNSSDCGLYLLQYVESFLKDPVVHFDLPLHLERWFPRQQVRRKRDEIRDLVLNLYRKHQLDNKT